MNPTDRREQRLQSYKKAQSEKEIYERVLAPTLYEYVLWVLQETLQSGTKAALLSGKGWLSDVSCRTTALQTI